MNMPAIALGGTARPPEAEWACGCGASLATACTTLTAACRIDAELVTFRLEQAGATLLAMRDRSPYPAEYASAWPETLLDAAEAYGWHGETTRPAIPSNAAVSAMDATYRWLELVASPLTRRIVAARSLVNPVSGRHVIHWRRLGVMCHADYRAVQRWHAAGIDAIADALVT